MVLPCSYDEETRSEDLERERFMDNWFMTHSSSPAAASTLLYLCKGFNTFFACSAGHVFCARYGFHSRHNFKLSSHRIFYNKGSSINYVTFLRGTRFKIFRNSRAQLKKKRDT